MLYANIVHVVKNCYKIKIDSRDWQSVFHRFLQCSTPHFFHSRLLYTTKGLHLESKEALIAMQRKLEWSEKVVSLQ